MLAKPYRSLFAAWRLATASALSLRLTLSGSACRCHMYCSGATSRAAGWLWPQWACDPPWRYRDVMLCKGRCPGLAWAWWVDAVTAQNVTLFALVKTQPPCGHGERGQEALQEESCPSGEVGGSSSGCR